MNAPADNGCWYCLTRRAVTQDHVVPKSVRKRLRSVWERSDARRMRVPVPLVNTALLDTVPACFECNVAKGARLLVPRAWAHLLDELNALGIGRFRMWDGSAAALRETVKR